MILEGIVTTTNLDGTTNISPMGPNVEPEFETFELRPFQSSRTYKNLSQNRCGVLHVVDDVLLIAQAAIHQWIRKPTLVDADVVDVQRLSEACEAHEFEVSFLDASSDRTTVKCRVVRKHFGPRFFGFNRGKHAVLEAAILATRVNFLPGSEVQSRFRELYTSIEKTGGQDEHRAFELLNTFVCESVSRQDQESNQNSRSQPPIDD